MSKRYPTVGDTRKKPTPQKDGIKHIGLPCIVCEKNTLGQVFIEVSYMRGDDECVRACYDHYRDKSALINAFLTTVTA